MKKKPQDSEDIERAVYDGMQDLRTPKLTPRAAKSKGNRAKKRLRPARGKARG